MDDDQIVELYLCRDEAAIEQTAEKFGTRLRSLAYGIVADMQTAEECENDTYLKAWTSIPPHEPRSYLYAFLARITRHISLNRCRDRSRLKRSAYISEFSTEMEQCIPAPDDVEIEVLQSMTSTISFTPAMPLPNECRFTRNASYEDICSAAEYLKTEYSSLLSMKNPQINIYGGDYNIYHQQGYQIAFFDAGGSDVEQIINYNFYQTAFYCDEEGNLFLIRIYRPDLSEPVGEYPIITLKEAKKLLSDGNYLTTVPYEMPGMEYVKKAELVYRTGERENYFMPYYRFYVEIPELEEDGLKTFGAYYVPAVDAAYIENMPVWQHIHIEQLNKFSKNARKSLHLAI